VVIPYRRPHAVTCSLQSRLFRYVGKGPVVIVSEETIPELRRRFVRGLAIGLRILQSGPIDEKYVLPAIFVVIEHGDTAGHGFDQIFVSRGGVAMQEMKASSLRSVHEFRSGCLAIC